MSSVPEFDFEMSDSLVVAPLKIKNTILKYTHDTQELYLILHEISDYIDSIKIYMPFGSLDSMPPFNVDATHTLVSGSALEQPSSRFELQISPLPSQNTFTIHINGPQSYWTKIYTYLFTQEEEDPDQVSTEQLYAALRNRWSLFLAREAALVGQQAEEDEDESLDDAMGQPQDGAHYSVVLRL